MRKIIVLVSEPSPAEESADERATRHDVVQGALASQAAIMAAAESGVSGLVLSAVHRPFAPQDDLVAMIELWTENEDLGRLVAQCVPAALRTQLSLTVSATATSEIIIKEVLHFANAESPWRIKLAGTAFRRDDFTTEEFFTYWSDIHAHISGRVPGVRGYVVSRNTQVIEGTDETDAIVAQWYADEAAFDAAQATPEAATTWADVANYARTTGRFWLMTETVIVTPPASGPGLLEPGNS